MTLISEYKSEKSSALSDISIEMTKQKKLEQGLELANVEVERVPIMVGPQAHVKIKREKENLEREKEINYASFNH